MNTQLQEKINNYIKPLVIFSWLYGLYEMLEYVESQYD